MKRILTIVAIILIAYLLLNGSYLSMILLRVVVTVLFFLVFLCILIVDFQDCKKKFSFKIIVPITLMAGLFYVIYLCIPGYLDLPSALTSHYTVSTGIVTKSVSIAPQHDKDYDTLTLDGIEFKYYLDKQNIKVGDTVIVTYLPHSKRVITILKH